MANLCARNSVVVAVYVSFLLDNVLLTVVVPIVPDYIATSGTSKIGIEGENGPIGALLSSKALIQLIANPLVGYVTAKFGSYIPLIFGTVNLLVTSVVFAYAQSYWWLLAARSLHGIASASIAVSGMSAVASLYDGKARGRVMSLLLGSTALGVLIGYPLGGIMYDLAGKSAPFILISILLAIDVAYQAFCLQRNYPILQNDNTEQSAEWFSLVQDQPVAIMAGAILVSTSAMAVLEPCLPLWLMATFSPARWQLGLVFVPDSIGYLLGTNSGAVVTGGWRTAMSAMVLVGLCTCLIPWANTVRQLMVPHFGLGLGIGLLDAALVPMLAQVVDSRHGSHYGAVYALQQIAVSLAYSLGPLVGGELVNAIGFPWLMRLIGTINLLYCPLLKLLSQGKEAEEPLSMETVRYRSTDTVSYERFQDETN